MLISPYDAHICEGETVRRYQTHNVETEAANVLMNANCPTVQTPEFYSSKCLKRQLMAEIIIIIITSSNFFITNIISDLTHTENVYFRMDYFKTLFLNQHLIYVILMVYGKCLLIIKGTLK